MEFPKKTLPLNIHAFIQNLFSNPRKLVKYAPIALILVLATILYLHDLGHESLWMDELISVDRAKTENLLLIRVRPLYYWLLNLWMRLGSGDAWLRGLNVCFSLGSVWLTYRLGRRLVNEASGTIAALIFVLSPLVIHHAQEVRMYAPCVFLGLLGTLLMVDVLENPQVYRIGLWAVTRWLAILATPLALLLVLPDTVLFVCRYWRRSRLLYRFGLGLVLVGALWLPWVLEVAIGSLSFMGAHTVSPEVEVVEKAAAINWFGFLYQIGSFTAWNFGRPNSEIIWRFYQFYAVVALSLTGLWLFKPSLRNSRLSWVAAWGFLPLMVMLLTAFGPRSLWVNRYLIFTAPYIFIVLAACFWELARTRRGLAALVASLYLVAIAGGLKRYYAVDDRENWRDLVGLINQSEQPGDVIVWSMNQANPVALNHYYQGTEKIAVIPYGHRYLTPEVSELASAKNWIANFPTTHSRIWLAYAETSPEFVDILASQFEILDHQTFSGYLDVFLLQPRPEDKAESPN